MIANNIDRHPNISVVMSVFSEKTEWLQSAIKSILTQSFNDFEFIIVNDNPQDNRIHDLLEKFASKDARIKIVHNVSNLGLTKSLNIALELAKGNYIARMDADDISLPNRFEVQYNYLEKHKDISILGARIEFIGSRKGIWKIPITPDDIHVHLLFKSCVAHPSVMMRKCDLDRFNIKYDEEFTKAQDFELWARTSKFLRIANLKKVLLKYRVHDNQISSLSRNSQINFADSIILRQLELLEVNLTDIEKGAFQNFTNNSFVYSIDSILALDNVFLKIRNNNNKLLIFDSISLQKHLEYLLFKTFVSFVIANKSFLNLYFKLDFFKSKRISILFQSFAKILCNKF